MLKRSIALILIAVLALCIFGGCGSSTSTDSAGAPASESSSGSQSSGDQGNSGGSGSSGSPAESVAESSLGAKDPTVLNFCVNSDPTILLPTVVNTVADMRIVYNIFDTLVDLGDDGETVVPALAESWDISDDGMVYTFHLRQGVHFSNGVELTAEDVIYSYDLESASVASGAFINTFSEWIALDDYTVQMTLAEPIVYGLEGLTHVGLGIMCKSVIEEYGETTDACIGTGAYYITEWLPGEKVVLTANDDYWGGEPSIKTVNVYVILDDNAGLVSFYNGELDLYDRATAFDLEDAAGNSDVMILNHESNCISGVFLNTSAQFIDNILIRKALNYAVDEEVINLSAYDGLCEPCNGQLCRPGNVGYIENYDNYAYNPDKAVELIHEAGYEPEEISFRILYPTTTLGTKIATALQSMFTAIGLNASLDGVESNSVVSKALAGDYELYVNVDMGTNSACSPTIYRMSYYSGGFSVLYHLTEENQALLDASLDEAATATNREELMEGFANVIRTVEQTVCLHIPMVYLNYNVLYDARLTGLRYDTGIFCCKFYRLEWVM